MKSTHTTKAVHTNEYGDFMPCNIGNTIVQWHDDIKNKLKTDFLAKCSIPTWPAP
jgi:hypothetical protein